MYNRNKFESIKTVQLLKFVQSEAITLGNPKFKKGSKTKTTVRRISDLRIARKELIIRLEKMDRTNPEFFPVDCFIMYEYERCGQVISHDKKEVYIKLEDEEFLIRVDLSKLTLLHIRETY